MDKILVWFTIASSITIAWLFGGDDLPNVVFSLFFATAWIGLYYIAFPKTLLQQTAFVFGVILILLTVVRVNEMILFFDYVALVYLGSYLLYKEKDIMTLVDLVLLPLGSLVNIIQTPNSAVPFKKVLSSRTSLAKSISTEMFFSIGLAVLLAVVIIPILSSANPVFANVLQTILQQFQLENISTWLVERGFSEIVMRTVGAVFLSLFFARAFSIVSQQGKTLNLPEKQLQLAWFIPKVTVLVILALFFVSEIQLYFASDSTLASLNLSNSTQTREIFSQLAVVSVIVFFLQYFSGQGKGFEQMLSWELLISVVFLNMIAFRSVFNYVDFWGLTYKRLWGFAIVTWVMAVVGLFIYRYKKEMSGTLFVRIGFLLTIGMLILVNLTNFDYLIYHVGTVKTAKGIDYGYLSRLSPDSLSYRQQLEELYTLAVGIEDGSVTDIDPIQIHAALTELLWQYEKLEQKYGSGVPVQSFSVLEYMQYLDLKEIGPKVVDFYNQNSWKYVVPFKQSPFYQEQL